MIVVCRLVALGIGLASGLGSWHLLAFLAALLRHELVAGRVPRQTGRIARHRVRPEPVVVQSVAGAHALGGIHVEQLAEQV